MKKYYSLGELLKEYRRMNHLSQSDLAIKMNADIRTVQRWEKNETIIKEEKVAELVEETLLPFQLIRNLNANDPIPTYFDFKTQKYSLSELAIDLPDASWYKLKMNAKTDRIRAIDLDYDFEFLMNAMQISEVCHKSMLALLKEALFHLPKVNMLITDELGFYAGFSLVLPISEKAYLDLKSQKIKPDELNETHIVDPDFQEKCIYLSFHLTADSNDNIQYLIGAILVFFDQIKEKDYLYCMIENRKDAYHLPEQLGLKEIWNNVSGNDFQSFFEGDFRAFLKGA